LCTAACYDCLLDYGNQRDHELLDHRLIRELLIQLARSSVVPKGQPAAAGDLLQQLWQNCDSELERKWLKLIEGHGFVPPSHGQYLITACSTKPDFFYMDHNVAVYIDGPPHDTSDAQTHDKSVDAKLRAAGYSPIRFHHKADWLEILHNHSDIFGPGRSIE